jgi:Flp pilus assembly protein TadG
MLFFTMIFGALEISRYIYVQHAVQMVAYEASRSGVVPGATYETVATRAQNLLAATGIPNANVSITPSTITPQTRSVSVTVTALFSDNSWIPPTYLTNNTITSTITLQHENNAYLDPDDTDVETLIGNNDDEPVDL